MPYGAGGAKDQPDAADSDNTVLIKVDDLINAAFGPDDKNRVDFKLLGSVLHTLARQMRILEQTVEIRLDERGGSSQPTNDTSDDDS